MATTSKRSNTRTRKARPRLAELNQTEAAAALGVSVRQFQKYQLEPVARRGRQVFYTLPALIEFAEARGHRKGFEEGLRAGKAPESVAELLVAKEQAELDLTRERAEHQRLRNAELRRELAPVEVLTWALSDVASQIVPLLTSIPGDIKRRNPKLTHQDIHVMREVIANALNLVAEVRIDWDGYEPDEAA